MASIIDRIATIVAANVNDFLDKPIDVPVAVDEHRQRIADSFERLQEQVDALYAQERRAKEALDKVVADIRRLDDLARYSLAAGDEPAARDCLDKKASLAERMQTLQQSYDTAHETAEKMRVMRDNLATEIDALDGGDEDQADADEPDGPAWRFEARDHEPQLTEEELRVRRLEEELANLGK